MTMRQGLWRLQLRTTMAWRRLLAPAMSELSIELTDQELAATRTMLCALLAADTGVLATLDDAARNWLQGLLASSASEDVPN